MGSFVVLCSLFRRGRPSSVHSRQLLLTSLIVAVSCGGAAKEVESGSRASSESEFEETPSSPRAPRAGTAQTSGPRSVSVRAQSLSVTLPDADHWKKLGDSRLWTGLRNDFSDSELWLRHSSARRTVTPEECEKEARLSLAILRDGATEAHSRGLGAPAGYGGIVRVVLLSNGGGRVEAFGAGLGRCLAVVFTTGAEPGFPARLQGAVNEIFGSFKILALEERQIAREPLKY